MEIVNVHECRKCTKPIRILFSEAPELGFLHGLECVSETAKDSGPERAAGPISRGRRNIGEGNGKGNVCINDENAPNPFEFYFPGHWILASNWAHHVHHSRRRAVYLKWLPGRFPWLAGLFGNVAKMGISALRTKMPRTPSNFIFRGTRFWPPTWPPCSTQPPQCSVP